MQETFGEQIRNAATAKRFSKLRLVGELLESNRIISEDNRQIFALGEDVKILRSALQRIASGIGGDLLGPTSMTREEMQDVAREALRPNSEIRQAGPETHDKQQQRNPALPASNG